MHKFLNHEKVKINPKIVEIFQLDMPTIKIITPNNKHLMRVTTTPILPEYDDSDGMLKFQFFCTLTDN